MGNIIRDLRTRFVALGLASTVGLLLACGGGPTGPTAPARGPLVVTGNASILDRQFNQKTAPTVVAVLAGSWDGTFCAQTTSASDGSYSISIPSSCFLDGQPVYFTAGGFNTCLSVPFAATGHARAILIGRMSNTCGMVAEGHAGYLAGTIGRGTPKGFLSTFVGAWGQTWRGRYCTQTLGGEDGSFAFEIPETCFQEAETVFLTSGGLDTCVTIPYARATITTGLVLYGRWGGCP